MKKEHIEKAKKIAGKSAEVIGAAGVGAVVTGMTLKKEEENATQEDQEVVIEDTPVENPEAVIVDNPEEVMVESLEEVVIEEPQPILETITVEPEPIVEEELLAQNEGTDSMDVYIDPAEVEIDIESPSDTNDWEENLLADGSDTDSLLTDCDPGNIDPLNDILA